MTTIIYNLSRIGGRALLAGWLAVVLTGLTAAAAIADDARTIRLLGPLDGATVRETVPVRVSPSDLPSDGYVTVSIDKVFRTARLIDSGTSLIYSWDTQASYQDPNEPGVDKYTDDGPHEIEVSVYDRQGTLLATGSSTIKLANKVTNLPDGITLSYTWSEDSTLRYKRHSELNMLSEGTGSAAQNGQTADIRFSRSVEDATSGEYLVRDMVYNDGIIVTNGASSPVQNEYVLKSRYRTVNRLGEVLVEETPFSLGDHFGFPIAEVPDRRITVGDSWTSRIEVSVPWADEKPTELVGSARLDSFEWQDGYPTAKVIETYDGSAQFYADSKGTVQFQADNVHLVRTYWFAYNSKRMVRMRTDMVIDGNVAPTIVSELGTVGGQSIAGAPQAAPAAPSLENQLQTQVQNLFGGDDGTGDQSQGGGVPGAPGAAGQPTTTPIKLEIIDDTVLVGV